MRKILLVFLIVLFLIFAIFTNIKSSEVFHAGASAARSGNVMSNETEESIQLSNSTIIDISVSDEVISIEVKPNSTSIGILGLCIVSLIIGIFTIWFLTKRKGKSG